MHIQQIHSSVILYNASIISNDVCRCRLNYKCTVYLAFGKLAQSQRVKSIVEVHQILSLPNKFMEIS